MQLLLSQCSIILCFFIQEREKEDIHIFSSNNFHCIIFRAFIDFNFSLFSAAAAALNLHKNGIESWMILDDLIRVGVLLLVRFKVQDAASHHIVVLIDRPYSQSTHQRLGVLELFSELNFGPAGKQFELEAVCSSQVCFPDDVVFIRIVMVEKGLAEVVVLKGFFDQKLQCGFHFYLNEFLGWFCLSSFNFLSFLVVLQIANLQWPNFTGDADSSEIQNMFKVRSVEFLRLQDVLGSLQLQIASIVVAVGGFTVSWFRPRSQCDFRCRIVPSPSISHS